MNVGQRSTQPLGGDSALQAGLDDVEPEVEEDKKDKKNGKEKGKR